MSLPGMPGVNPTEGAASPVLRLAGGGTKSPLQALMHAPPDHARNVMLDLGMTGYAHSSPDASLMKGKSAARLKMIKSVKKVAVMSKVVEDMGSNTIFEALDKQKKSKNPCVNLYRIIIAFELSPYSNFHTVWDVFILVLVVYSSIMEPYNAAFDQSFVVGAETATTDGKFHEHLLVDDFRQTESPGMDWFAICVDLAFYIDIILNFFTGYDRGYEIVYEKKVIAKNYLALWFWVDILATVEWDLIVGALFKDVDQGTVRLVRLIKVARLARASRLVHRLTAAWTINTGFVEAAKFIIYVLICAHILGCFFFMVPTLITCEGHDTPFALNDAIELTGTPGKDYEMGHPNEHMKNDCMKNSWRDGNFDEWVPTMPVFDTLKAKEDFSCDDSFSCFATHKDECSGIDLSDAGATGGTDDPVSAADICNAHEITTAATCTSDTNPTTCATGFDGSSGTCTPSGTCLYTAALPPRRLCAWTGDGGAGGACVAGVPRAAVVENLWETAPGSPLFCGKAAGLARQVKEKSADYVTGCVNDPSVNAAVCEVRENIVYLLEDGECETIVGYGDWKPLMGRSYAYVMSMYWAITTMTTIGYGDIGPASQPEIIFVLFAEIIGLSFFAVLLDQINKLNDVLGKQAAEANMVKNEVIGFMKSNQAPMVLIHKTIAFLNFKANSNSGSTVEDSDERFAPLSEPLKRRIKIALFKPALINVKMLGHAKDSIEEDERVKELFDETDTDHGGTLDHDEIKGLIARLGMVMTEEQMQSAFTEMDGDNEGTIDMDEFEQWWFLKKFGVPKIVPPPHGFLEEMAFRMSSRTQAKAPGDHILEAGEYGMRLFVLLAGTVVINGSGPIPEPLVLPRKVRHEDREPIFGLSAALRPQYQQPIEAVTQDWTVDAATYCDLVFIDKQDCPELFRDTWPSGPEELLRVAKYFYIFDDANADGAPHTEDLVPGGMGGMSPRDTVKHAEKRLNGKISAVQKTLKTSLASIDSKLDKLLAG